MKRILSLLFSMPFAGFLLLVAAFVMGVATFIESSYGTAAARIFVYNAWWFELILFLLTVNLIYNFLRYKLYMLSKLSLGVFHLSFVFILLGASITRYVGFEGVMHIREGDQSNTILSQKNYLRVEHNNRTWEDEMILSGAAPAKAKQTIKIDGKSYHFKSVRFLPNVNRELVPDPAGSAVIDMVVSKNMNMQQVYLQEGEIFTYNGYKIGLDTETECDINLRLEGNVLKMITPLPSSEYSMTTRDTTFYQAGEQIDLKKLKLYGIEPFRFLVKDFHPLATFRAMPSGEQTAEDALTIHISGGANEQSVTLFGRAGSMNQWSEVDYDGKQFTLGFGAKSIKLPFSLKLNDFTVERYPGSESPSAFISDLVLSDPENGIEKEVQVFMNNTLKHRDYRFYQSSFDADEQGTILSVNNDYWGTLVTYVGYFLLIFGIIWTLINPKSYFHHLIRQLKQKPVGVLLLIIFLSLSNTSFSATSSWADSLSDMNKAVVKQFEQLHVQGRDGRIKPMSTLSSEILRKISKRSSLYGRTAGEVMLGMVCEREKWSQVPIIRVSNKQVAKELGIDGRYIAITDFFDANENYKILSRVREAYNIQPAMRTRVDKEYIYVDERLNVALMVMRGEIFSLFPGREVNKPWMSPGSIPRNMSPDDSLFVHKSFQLVVQSVNRSDHVTAGQIIAGIGKYQQKYAGSILPGESKMKLESLYNKLYVFKRLFPVYLILGFVLLSVLFVNIFRQKRMNRYLLAGFIVPIVFAFIVHTAGLIARWYISGHAPWSNGYESMIYVAWACMFGGLVLGRKYPMVLGAASFLTGIALFVAHLSWMNPEITNLVPVLKSYWLTIHVAVIVASYGFIGLSAVLGILNLLFFIFRTQGNHKRINVYIHQLTIINQMSVMLGLYLLTIGTFLGAIWANESWGRYWGWDPKETWSLITILIYSFIAHMRMIPSLKSEYTFNVSTVLGLFSVLMTYLGVNYYLTGLHSYGSGTAGSVHWALPAAVILISFLIIYAWHRNGMYKKQVVG